MKEQTVANQQASAAADQQASAAAEAAAEPKRDLLEVVGGLLRGETAPTDTDTGQPRGDSMASPADPDKAEAQGELSDEGLGLQPDATTESGGDIDAAASSLLQALAEKAGVSVKELYKVQIPLGNERDPVSIGDMKDAYQTAQNLTDERDTFNDTRAAFENDMLRSRAELQEIVALLPEIPEALVNQGKATHAASIERERAALYHIKPEWRDPEVFARIQDGIFQTVQEYGFSRPEMDSVFDHRLTKLLHDFVTMRKRFADANASRKRIVDEADTNKQGRKSGSNRIVAKRAATQKLTEAGAAPMHSPTKLDAVKGILTQASIIKG